MTKPEKKRDLNNIREHANDEEEIPAILGVTKNQFDHCKRDVIDSFKNLYEDCSNAVSAGFYMLSNVLKIENYDAETLARAICFTELLTVSCAVQAKVLMDEVTKLMQSHQRNGVCGIGLIPPRNLFDKPRLVALEPCGGCDDDDEPEQSEEHEDADRLSYIR